MKKISIIIAMCVCSFFGIMLFSSDAFAVVGLWVSRVTTGVFIDVMMQLIGQGTAFCWFCGMMETLFDAMNTLTTNLVKSMANTFLMVMGVGLLFSIAFKVAKMLTSLQAVDVMQFLNDMFRHLGRAIIAMAFLTFSLAIFAHVVSPMLTLSLSLGQTIMEKGGGIATLTTAMQDLQRKSQGSVRFMGVCEDLNIAEKARQAASIKNENEMPKAFTDDVKAEFICFLRTASASLMFGVVLGATLFATAFHECCVWLKVFPNVGYMAAGVLIMIGHLLIMIALPFKLVDGLIRMAFVCALAPLWIIFWVFPATVGYTKKAWDMFISTCAIFLCLSVVLVLIMHLMTATIPNREAVIQYLVKDQLAQAAKLIPMSGSSFLVTLVMCFIGFKLLGTATTLASSFVGAIPNLGVGDQMAKTSASLTKRGAGMAKAGAIAGMEAVGIDGATRQKWGAAIGKEAGLAALSFATGGVAGALRIGNAVRNLYNKKAADRASFRATNPLKMGAGGTNPGVNPANMSFVKSTTNHAGRGGPLTEKHYRGTDGTQLKQSFNQDGTLAAESFSYRDGSQMMKLYDKNNRLMTESFRNKDGSGWQKFYDKNGTKTTVNTDALNRKVSSEIISPDGKQTNIKFDPATGKEIGREVTMAPVEPKTEKTQGTPSQTADAKPADSSQTPPVSSAGIEASQSASSGTASGSEAATFVQSDSTGETGGAQAPAPAPAPAPETAPVPSASEIPSSPAAPAPAPESAPAPAPSASETPSSPAAPAVTPTASGSGSGAASDSSSADRSRSEAENIARAARSAAEQATRTSENAAQMANIAMQQNQQKPKTDKKTNKDV